MTEELDVNLGRRMGAWRELEAQTITLMITEDCNLRCSYCYFGGRHSDKSMPLDVAKQTIDYLLGCDHFANKGSVIWEFIGGEPFLQVGLMEQITDYIKLTMYETEHQWFDNYRFNISSNGVLYGSPAVQRYIAENRNCLNVGISLDGNKKKHDMFRIKEDGSGSFEEVVKHIPLWKQQFPGGGVKCTYSSDDLIYLKDSVIFLWGLGITEVAANVVYEDAWKEGDDEVLESQMKQLADHVIDNGLWSSVNCTLFSKQIGKPAVDNNNWCGAGEMLAVDVDGNFLPCIRFAKHALVNKPPRIIGNYKDGYDFDKLRPFLSLDLISQSSDECIECEVAMGCGWCQGYNYDEASINTIYNRATHICKMHKARCRANEYYYHRLEAALA